MNSADLQTVVITCPNCGTRYQVPYGTIGQAGREVQCAQCTKHWHAMAEAPPPPPVPVAAPVDDDKLFSPADERALDEAFEAEARGNAPTAPVPVLPATVPVNTEHQRTLAEIKAAITPRPKKEPANPIDAAKLNQNKRYFDKRQRSIRSRLPLARVRRTARLAAFVLLVSILVLGFALRTDLVRWYPALAGLYAAIGMPVNVVGLEFEGEKTMMSFRAGKPVMMITANVRSVASDTVQVPPVLVSLLNNSGAAVYEWTVTLKATEMEPGEVLEFSTEVSAPPQDAVTVRLSFTNPRAVSAAPAGTI
jgi:predicted Zn finger-like uncharacterized protein